MRHTRRTFIVSVLIGSWLIASASCQAGSVRPQTERTLRVLTYNIHHGEAMDRQFDYERLAKVINDLSPDIVALQEVDRGTKRASGVDQAALLGKLCKMHHVFGQAMPYQGGQYGEAILSRQEEIMKLSVELAADKTDLGRVAGEWYGGAGVAGRLDGLELSALASGASLSALLKNLNARLDIRNVDLTIDGKSASRPMRVVLDAAGRLLRALSWAQYGMDRFCEHTNCSRAKRRLNLIA